MGIIHISFHFIDWEKELLNEFQSTAFDDDVGDLKFLETVKYGDIVMKDGINNYDCTHIYMYF